MAKEASRAKLILQIGILFHRHGRWNGSWRVKLIRWIHGSRPIIVDPFVPKIYTVYKKDLLISQIMFSTSFMKKNVLFQGSKVTSRKLVR